MESTLSQGYAALAFAYVGVVLGVFYDALRLLRLKLDCKAVTNAADALFVLALFTGCYAAFHLCTSGTVRLYGLCCILAGAALQQWAFGRAICKRIVKRRK